MIKTLRFGILLFSLVLTASLAACVSLASDITPPPGYIPPSPQPTTAPVYPIVPPDPAAGAVIFAEKCAPCHGESGMGDGPQSSGLSVAPAALANPQVFRAARPTEWFDLVTNGNLERMMPPFKSLNDRQRWDVVAYALTLGVTNAELEQGKLTYESGCITCHGSSGSAPGAADWTDPAVLANLSNRELFDTITNGVSDDMPAYGQSYTEEMRWAVTAYVRSLSFAQPQAEAYPAPQAETPVVEGQASATPVVPTDTTSETPAATLETSPTEVVLENFDIQGKLTRADGSALADGTSVTLESYDNMNLSSSVDAPVSSDGTFKFEDVEAEVGRVYLVSLTYQGVLYTSDPIHMTDISAGQPVVAVEISVADASTDASSLVVERMHVFFDFPENTQTLQVVELYIIDNPTDRVIVSPDGQQPVVSYTLPDGALNLMFEDGALGGRFIQTETGFGDTEPIPPGSGFQVLFGYELPYTNKLKFNLPISLPVQAVVVMVPEGLKLKSDQLNSSGPTTMQGMNIEVFTATNQSAGNAIDINLSGRPGVSDSSAAGNNWISLVIGGLALAGALVGAGWLILRQRKGKELETGDEESREESADDVMDAIIALDDLFNAGQLPRQAYEERRAELKTRLAGLKEKE